MKNITNKTKTILFTSLIAAIILPLSINDASAEEQTTIYDPVVVEYIENLISQPGKNIQEKTFDGETVSVVTKTRQISDQKYHVKTVTKIDGEKQSAENFRILVNDNDTYTLINHNLGIHETFTDVSTGAVGDGSGHSDINGARIDLHDREIGTPNNLSLYDRYSACFGSNYAVFSATVTPSVIDVNWHANWYYSYWCFVPHEFIHGDVQYGTNHYYLNGVDDARGFHAFSNIQGGTTWYDVDVDFVYGAW